MLFIACFSKDVSEWLSNDVNRKLKECLIDFIIATKFLMVKIKDNIEHLIFRIEIYA